jgi:serine/threonine protein kinase
LDELQQRRKSTTTSRLFDEDTIQSFLFDILSALVYLRKSIFSKVVIFVKHVCFVGTEGNFGAHRNLSLENIMLDKRTPNNLVCKLADYYLYHLTNRGNDVNFVVGFVILLYFQILYMYNEIYFFIPMA